MRWPGSERRGKWGGGGGGPRERCRDASHLGKFNQWARASGASNVSPRSAVARAALRWWELPDEPSPGGHEDPREPATRRAHPLAASFGPSRRRYRGGRAVPGGFPGRRCPPAFQKAGTHGSQARQAPSARDGSGHPMMTTWSRRMSFTAWRRRSASAIEQGQGPRRARIAPPGRDPTKHAALRNGGGGREDDTSTARARGHVPAARVCAVVATFPKTSNLPRARQGPAGDAKRSSPTSTSSRQKNEREAKQRRGAREAKDHDRSASRLSGEDILHTPRAAVSPAGARTPVAAAPISTPSECRPRRRPSEAASPASRTAAEPAAATKKTAVGPRAVDPDPDPDPNLNPDPHPKTETEMKRRRSPLW